MGDERDRATEFGAAVAGACWLAAAALIALAVAQWVVERATGVHLPA